MSVTNNANIVAVMGGTGSGKSTYVKKEIRRLKTKRLIIFDVMHEYGQFGQVKKKLSEVIAAAKGQTFSIVYQPEAGDIKEKFEFICKLAFTLGDLVLVVEELNRVTAATGAPPQWQNCTSRGRHRGLNIYGVSQRPASLDKDFFSNATKIRTGRVNFEADIRTLANVLRVSKDEISSLKPLEYIERDMATHEISRGKLKI